MPDNSKEIFSVFRVLLRSLEDFLVFFFFNKGKSKNISIESEAEKEA
jgi:hypothetical protein